MKLITVCTGNICRSPMAEGLLRHLLNAREDIAIDSAATHAYHIGAKPDPRAIKEMQKHQIDITHLRARTLTTEDVAHPNHIILVAADEHLRYVENLKAQCSGKAQIIKLLIAHPDHPNADLFDPYYGDEADFTKVYQQLNASLSHWITTL